MTYLSIPELPTFYTQDILFGDGYNTDPVFDTAYDSGAVLLKGVVEHEAIAHMNNVVDDHTERKRPRKLLKLMSSASLGNDSTVLGCLLISFAIFMLAGYRATGLQGYRATGLQGYYFFLFLFFNLVFGCLLLIAYCIPLPLRQS